MAIIIVRNSQTNKDLRKQVLICLCLQNTISFDRILEGKEITVEYDRPTALQIDGETVLGVTSYTALASAVVPIKEKITVG